MLPRRRPLPLLLLVLLVGTSSLVLASPQQRERGRHGPPAQARAPVQQDRGPARAPVIAPAPSSQARQDHQNRRRERGDEALSDSIRRIERNTRGQVLSAERVPYDGRSINRIKVVDDRGRVRIYVDDPQSPAMAETPTRGDDD